MRYMTAAARTPTIQFRNMPEYVVFLETSIQYRSKAESVVYLKASNAERKGGYAI